ALLGLLPEREGAGGPVDVDAVGAVGAADDPGLATGAGARVARPPSVEQGDPRAAAKEVESRPTAEGAGADHGDVEGSHAAARSPCVDSTPCRPRTGAWCIAQAASGLWRWRSVSSSPIGTQRRPASRARRRKA